jgi:hypothetical protein
MRRNTPQHEHSRAMGLVLVLALFASVLTVATATLVSSTPAAAGVFFNDTEFTYKEYWADHATFTAGCGEHAVAGNSWYSEPDPCAKEIILDIPDDTSHAIAAVIYVDLWRNRLTKTARFTVNDGPQYRPAIGTNFSRTPFTASLPLTQLVQGPNSLKFQDASGPYTT